MNNILHDSTEPIIPGNVGWQQMQLLLNEHLPVKKQLVNWTLLLPYIAASVLILPLLFGSLQLHSPLLHAPLSKGNLLASKKNTGSGNAKLLLVTSKKTENTAGSNGVPSAGASSGIEVPFTAQPVLQPIENKAGSLVEMNTTFDKTNVATDIHTNLVPIAAALFPKEADTASPALKTYEKNKYKGYWNIYAGAGVNVSLHKNQDFQPYPIAEVKYNISPRFFIAAGLTAFSPVASNTGGISKTVYLDDTANNVKLYNEVTTFNKLYYADVPLTAGVNIGKKFSVQTGVQLSVLLGKGTKKTLMPYDFQMNDIRYTISTPVSSLAAAPQQNYDVAIKKLDYRFTTGVRYTLQKTIIGLTYQHSLNPVSVGSHATKNELLALSVLFKLK